MTQGIHSEDLHQVRGGSLGVPTVPAHPTPEGAFGQIRLVSLLEPFQNLPHPFAEGVVLMALNNYDGQNLPLPTRTRIGP